MEPQEVLSKELHRPKRRRYPTVSVITQSIDDLWQADLVEMGALASWNKGFAYLLTVIDTFSKYGFARTLRSKAGKEVTEAFRDILLKSGRKPRNLQTDQGKEFFNSNFERLMKEMSINHYHTFSDKKASIVERWNRSLKHMMWKRFTHNNSYKWTHLLPGIIEEYNDRTHRTIGMTPNEVTLENSPQVLQRLTKKTAQHSRGKGVLKIGDIVRISRIKPIFAKEATSPNWSEELFRIIEVQQTRPVTYKLEDLLQEPINGTFYQQELQKTSIPEYARIEKVLSRKQVSGRKRYLIRVKWKGYSNKFNQWIPLDKTKKL